MGKKNHSCNKKLRSLFESKYKEKEDMIGNRSQGKSWVDCTGIEELGSWCKKRTNCQ